MTEGEILS